MQYHLVVQKSRRKTICLSVTQNLEVLVKAPLSLPDSQINEFILRHETWIQKHLAMGQERHKMALQHQFTKNQIQELKEKTKQAVQQRIGYYVHTMGVKPKCITITSARKRWGSCSASNRICFSFLFALLPPEAQDYIMVHELAHICQKNHSAAFYGVVEGVLPDYKSRIGLLKETQQSLGL